MIEKLQFENLKFHYDTHSALFENVSVELPSNENVLILGNNGSGKSAVLKILAGLLSPVEGRYLINDENISEMNFEEFLPFRKRIGYSFDYGGLLANRTLRDNLLLPLQYHGQIPLNEAFDRVDRMMSRFRLTSHRDRRPAAVSGSTRKTAIIARSLVMHPELLLLDDPFTGLDREGVTGLLEMIDEHRKEHGLKHLFFTSRGESVSSKLATTTMTVENHNLCLVSESGKAVGL